MNDRASDPERKRQVVQVTGIFGRRTKGPIVQIAIPRAALANIPQELVRPDGDDVVLQIEPADARALALNILEGAEAALSDGFLVGFLRDRLDVDDDGQLAQILGLFRGYRIRQSAEGT